MDKKKASRKRALEELTRKDILEGALTVLLSNGMKGFTIERVAKEAGIAQGTTYLYFKNKSELLTAVTDYAFVGLEQEYEFISKSDKPPEIKLECYAMASMKYIVKHQVLFKELRAVMFSTIDLHINDSHSWYWRTVDLFSTTLGEAIQEGKIRKINTAKVGALFFDSINSLMMHHIFSTVSEGVEEDVRDIIGIYLNGIAVQADAKQETMGLT